MAKGLKMYSPSGTAEKPNGSQLEYFLVLMLILVSAKFFLVHYNDELLAFSTFTSFLSAFLLRKKFSKWFVMLMMGYAIWVGLTVLYYDVWNARTIAGFFMRMIFAYTVLLVVREKFVTIFVNLVVWLSGITIPLYLAGILFPSMMLSIYNLLASFPNLFLYKSGLIVHGQFLDIWSRVNFLFYTFSPERLSQNHGFMWEPTAFAFMLIFALMLRMMKVGKRFDRKCWILIVALITTLSTTGYVVLIFIMAYLMYISGKKLRVIGVFLIVPTIIFVASTDFLLPKIVAEFERGALVEKGYGNSRFSSFIYDMEDVSQHPLLGLSIFEENRYAGYQKHADVNGLSDTLARFGLIGFSVMMVNLLWSLRSIPRRKELRGFNALFLVCVLMLSWSERMMYLPIFFAFQFYHFALLRNHAKSIQSVDYDRNCNVKVLT